MIKILFLAADPTDASRLRLGEEFREIQEKLRLARLRDRFVLFQKFSVRPADISQALLDYSPQIVHFSGHGTPTGALCFEDKLGESHPVQPEALASLFEQFALSVKCVILNACFSLPQAQAIAEHIDYVIGMNQEIGDKAAIAFAVGFYQALGAGRTIEESYKLGNVQIRLENLSEHLTPALIKRAGLLSDVKFSSVVDQPNGRNESELPSMLPTQFVGRQLLLENITKALEDPFEKWIVTIDGMGGIGKTALAREVLERTLARRLFNEAVWVQSPKDMNATHLLKGLRYETVLDAIARQLEAFDLLQIRGAEKEKLIREVLQKHRLLLVLDNLETAEEPQQSIVQHLYAILAPSKALLTSRHRFSGDVFAVHLAGLDEGEALELIHKEAINKNVSHIETAKPNELKQIAKSSGGSPLALKLLVGQLSHLPLGIVLEQIDSARLPDNDAEENEYIAFYRHIFMPSWSLLSETSQKLLISMAAFPAGIGGTFEAVKEISDLSKNVLVRCIDELWRFSFLEVARSSSLGKVRYYLHPLTQNFVVSDIIKYENLWPSQKHQ